MKLRKISLTTEMVIYLRHDIDILCHKSSRIKHCVRIINNFLSGLKCFQTIELTESAVATEKYQHGGFGPYIKDLGLIFSSNDQADEVNKKFII